MYRNHWVTSDVQFRKGASIPPFWVGLGWADLLSWFPSRAGGADWTPCRRSPTLSMFCRSRTICVAWCFRAVVCTSTDSPATSRSKGSTSWLKILCPLPRPLVGLTMAICVWMCVYVVCVYACLSMCCVYLCVCVCVYVCVSVFSKPYPTWKHWFSTFEIDMKSIFRGVKSLCKLYLWPFSGLLAQQASNFQKIPNSLYRIRIMA